MSKTKVGLANGMGRGVFATEYIRSRTIIFKAYTWILSKKDVDQLCKTSINGNYFENPFNDKESLLPLGELSLINHSITPNAEIDMIQTKLGIVVKCTAIKHINPKEQIFIDYGPNHLYGNR
jgi:hypothetical protein